MSYQYMVLLCARQNLQQCTYPLPPPQPLLRRRNRARNDTVCARSSCTTHATVTMPMPVSQSSQYRKIPILRLHLMPTRAAGARRSMTQTTTWLTPQKQSKVLSYSSCSLGFLPPSCNATPARTHGWLSSPSPSPPVPHPHPPPTNTRTHDLMFDSHGCYDVL